MKLSIVGLSLLVTSVFMLVAYTHPEAFSDGLDNKMITLLGFFFLGTAITWWGVFSTRKEEDK